jgi:UDP-N-acetyl-2-amino-2-deoxyglucuronate dehydrogenase
LHDAHVRFALRVGADAICEKPLVLNPWNIDALQELEHESGKRVFTILQLRVHPSLIELKSKILQTTTNKKRQIELTYITSRGGWYQVSWTGHPDRSGGLVTNIGIHFFDLLIWLFGAVQQSEVHVSTATKSCGYIELQNAEVRWFLSIDRSDLPESVRVKNQSTYRSITIDGNEIEFSGGFTDLHTVVYRDILSGGGFGLEAARPSVELVHEIRNAAGIGMNERSHPIAKKLLTN